MRVCIGIRTSIICLHMGERVAEYAIREEKWTERKEALKFTPRIYGVVSKYTQPTHWRHAHIQYTHIIVYIADFIYLAW